MNKRKTDPDKLKRIAYGNKVKGKSNSIGPQSTLNAGSEIPISVVDGIYGSIRNGDDGLIKRYLKTPSSSAVKGEVEILRFHGSIGPIYSIDDGVYGIGIQLNGARQEVFTLQDAIKFLRSHFSLTASKVQHLTEVIEGYAADEVNKGHAIPFSSSPINVQKDVITVNYPGNLDTCSILSNLRDFWPKAPHSDAFLVYLAHFLTAPLHYELKVRSRKNIKIPFILSSGVTGTGKTDTGHLIIGRGYSIAKEKYFLVQNRVRTIFTLTKHLEESNLPAILDDMSEEWIIKHKEELKAMVQAGNFGDRGLSDQTMNFYRAMRTLLITINDDIRSDSDRALDGRMILLRFTSENRSRIDRQEWDSLFNALPEGFMIQLFKEVFAGKNINDTLRDVRKFNDPEEWVNWGIDLINELCDKYQVEHFEYFSPEEEGSTYVTNAMEIIESFIAEWNRIERGRESYTDKDNVVHERNRYISRVDGEIDVRIKDDRLFILFTGHAFKEINNSLRTPYKNATNFLNNINSSDQGVRVENQGRIKSEWVDNKTGKFFTVSIPDYKALKEKEVR